MAAYRIVYLEPKYRIVQAKDMNDAQRQARMIIKQKNDQADDHTVLVRIEVPEPLHLVGEEIDYADVPQPA